MDRSLPLFIGAIVMLGTVWLLFTLSDEGQFGSHPYAWESEKKLKIIRNESAKVARETISTWTKNEMDVLCLKLDEGQAICAIFKKDMPIKDLFKTGIDPAKWNSDTFHEIITEHNFPLLISYDDAETRALDLGPRISVSPASWHKTWGKELLLEDENIKHGTLPEDTEISYVEAPFMFYKEGEDTAPNMMRGYENYMRICYDKNGKLVAVFMATPVGGKIPSEARRLLDTFRRRDRFLNQKVLTAGGVFLALLVGVFMVIRFIASQKISSLGGSGGTVKIRMNEDDQGPTTPLP